MAVAPTQLSLLGTEKRSRTRVLHTADWHLGHRLVEQDRTDEHRAFLEWLLALIKEKEIDLLIIAGDIFDSANPPKDAEALYFDFLRDVSALRRCEIVVIAGNHDSALHLGASSRVLKLIGVHVVAALPDLERLNDCFLSFPHLTVCAVPFLRERDLRQSRPGETSLEVQKEIREGIRGRYQELRRRYSERGNRAPLIATGHLTATGARTSDSEREIHVGTLAAVDADCFDGYAYVALGHLHRFQRVGTKGNVRYSGSPIPLSFSEAEDEKYVVMLEVTETGLGALSSLAVPQTRRLLRWKGNLEDLCLRLASIECSDALETWIETTVELTEPSAGADRIIRDSLRNPRARILKVICVYPENAQHRQEEAQADLEDLHPRDIFAARLREAGIDPGGEAGLQLRETFELLYARCAEQEQL